MKTEIEIINTAGHILTDPVKRIQGHFAKDANGSICHPDSEEARCFCLIGAISRAAADQDIPELYKWRKGTSIACYISGGAVGELGVGGLSVYWDAATTEEQTACAQRMVEYKGL